MSLSVVQALLAFLLVLVAIPFALAALRRTRHFGVGRRPVIRLTGGLALGPRERIAVVEVGGRWLVLGVTGQSIQLLTTLDEPPAEIGDAQGDVGPAGGAEAGGAAKGAFARVLAQARLRHGR